MKVYQVKIYKNHHIPEGRDQVLQICQKFNINKKLDFKRFQKLKIIKADDGPGLLFLVLMMLTVDGKKIEFM